MITIEQFLEGYDEDISALANTLRRFVVETEPGADEKLQVGWKCITYSHRKAFCSIIPHSRWVNLQFQAGASLEDGVRRLQGTGKNMRHVRVTAEAELDDSLANLVRLAADLAK